MHVTAHGATSGAGCKRCLFSWQIGGEVVYRSDEPVDTVARVLRGRVRRRVLSCAISRNQTMKGLVLQTIYIQLRGTTQTVFAVGVL